MAGEVNGEGGISRTRGANGTDATDRPVKRNALRPSATPPRQASQQKPAPTRRIARRASSENAIRPSRPKVRDRLAPSGADQRATAARGNGKAPAANPFARVQRPASASPDEIPVPEGIRRRFVQIGRKYYFPDGARAFTDRGRRLTTQSENTEVIASLIAIARARGWADITVSGTERFRKEAWFAGRLEGLKVRGYRASAFEQERLARTLARRDGIEADAPRPRQSGAEEPARSRGTGRRERGELIVGRLIDHGRSTFRHDPREPMSYFARIETARGERTLWGVDLERAFKESLTAPKPGDQVGLRAVRQDAVTVKARPRDGQTDGPAIETHRNRWLVEKRDFFDARAAAARTVADARVEPRRAVKSHPELAGTYLYLKGAEEVARRRIRDPQDQRRFVETVRRSLADSVARGEPLPPVRLRERGPARPAARVSARRQSHREHTAVRG